MRNLLVALLIVLLVPAAGLARGRGHCHNGGGGYRGAGYSRCYSYRAPRISYGYRSYGYRPNYYGSGGYGYTPQYRGAYFSIFHDSHPQPRVIPQPSAPSVYPPGQWPRIVHSPGVEYVNSELAPAPGGPSGAPSNP